MDSWNKKMADCLSDIAGRNGELESQAIEAALDAAGEIKCSHLKRLLTQSYQIIYEAHENGGQPTFDDGFLDILKQAAYS